MERIELDISVLTLAEAKGDVTDIILNGTDGKLELDKQYNDLVFVIDYPLTKTHKIKIPFAQTISDILVPIAHAYENIIYADVNDSNPFGVYGHSLGDLFFEGITIRPNGISEVSIGS